MKFLNWFGGEEREEKKVCAKTFNLNNYLNVGSVVPAGT